MFYPFTFIDRGRAENAGSEFYILYGSNEFSLRVEIIGA